MRRIFNSKEFSKSDRNAYIRYLVKLLNKKYMVVQSKLALAIGIDGNYFRDFSSGRKDLNNEYLDDIESFIGDLYEGLWLYDLPQDDEEFKEFVLSLKDSPEYNYIVHGIEY